MLMNIETCSRTRQPLSPWFLEQYIYIYICMYTYWFVFAWLPGFSGYSKSSVLPKRFFTGDFQVLLAGTCDSDSKPVLDEPASRVLMAKGPHKNNLIVNPSSHILQDQFATRKHIGSLPSWEDNWLLQGVLHAMNHHKLRSNTLSHPTPKRWHELSFIPLFVLATCYRFICASISIIWSFVPIFLRWARLPGVHYS